MNSNLYIVFTIKITEWRIAIRKKMNIADENASTKAVDSLLNYETVKYFNAEIMEADRFNKATLGGCVIKKVNQTVIISKEH